MVKSFRMKVIVSLKNNSTRNQLNILIKSRAIHKFELYFIKFSWSTFISFLSNSQGSSTFNITFQFELVMYEGAIKSVSLCKQKDIIFLPHFKLTHFLMAHL